jgi:molybdopterin-guanine dinucleotide biosynthesis protein A
MIHDIPAVIFAGGKSSRMGKDKALLPFGGYDSLVEYQYAKLQKLFNDVYISAKNDKFDFNANVIYDTYTINSPLGAIISVLEYTQRPTFILSVDAPFVDEDIIQKLISKYENSSIATVAQTKDGLQPLCAIYNLSFVPKAKVQFQNGNHKINYILKNENITSVFFEDDNKFLNVNYPKDYQKALEYDTI